MFSSFKKPPLRRQLLAIGLSGLLGACSEPASPEAGFDFSHVDLAIRYFETASENVIGEIAATEAARHLKRHSDRTGYYSPDATVEDITQDLLKETPPGLTLQEVQALVSYARDNPQRQCACLAEAEKYLPAEATMQFPLYITYGYDIGVAMDGHASLNFAHPRFLADREEIWFYCTHEGHHAGVMQLHPMGPINEIDTVRELYDFVKYSTFLEGLAVYAAWDARSKAGALENDQDYSNLENREKLDEILAAYWQKLETLESVIGNPLTETHWQAIEDMSSGDRLWYVAGAAMAKAIEEALGREGLIEVVREGPDSFFEAYEKIVKERQ